MKGRIGTASTVNYAKPYLIPRLYRLAIYETLSDKAKIKFKAINLYSSGKYTIGQICEIFEIDRSTFYRWRKSYNPKSLKSLDWCAPQISDNKLRDRSQPNPLLELAWGQVSKR